MSDDILWFFDEAGGLGLGREVLDLGPNLVRVRFAKREATLRKKDLRLATDDEIRRGAHKIPAPVERPQVRIDSVPVRRRRR